MKKILLVIALFAAIMPFGVNEAIAACWNGGTCNHISQNKIRVSNYGCGYNCYNYTNGCGSNCYTQSYYEAGCRYNCYQQSNGCGSYCYNNNNYNTGCNSNCYQNYGNCGYYCNQNVSNYRPECYYCGRNYYQAQQYYGNYDYQYYSSVGYY